MNKSYGAEIYGQKIFHVKSFGEQIILQIETFVWKNLFNSRKFWGVFLIPRNLWLKASELKYVG